MSWPKVSFGELCKLVNGKAYKPTDWSSSGLPIIRIQNLNDHEKPFNYWNGLLTNQVLVKNGDVLLAWSGTPGTSFGAHLWTRGEAVLNQHIFRVDLDCESISKRWAIFAVNKQLNKLIDQSHGGVGLKHVTKGMVESLEIPLPPMVEQRRIVEILDKADTIRKKRHQAIRLPDDFLRATFLDMFGDPVLNPKNWQIVTCESICERVTVGIVVRPASHYKEYGIPALRSLNIRTNKIETDNLVFFSSEDNETKLAKTRVWQDDILLVRSGQPGTAAIVPEDLDGVNAIDLLITTPNKSKVDPIYLCFYFNSEGGKRLVLGEQRGQIQKHLNVGSLKSAPIPIPPLDLQAEFSIAVKKLESVKEKLFAALANANTLFNSLGQKAFNGEV